jgi:hypothetical protein
VSKTAERPVDFVTKEEEPGDIGIQGIVKDANDKSQLDLFRSQIIRAVYIKNPNPRASARFFTLNKDGTASAGAIKPDQTLLAKLAKL